MSQLGSGARLPGKVIKRPTNEHRRKCQPSLSFQRGHGHGDLSTCAFKLIPIDALLPCPPRLKKIMAFPPAYNHPYHQQHQQHQGMTSDGSILHCSLHLSLLQFLIFRQHLPPMNLISPNNLQLPWGRLLQDRWTPVLATCQLTY